VAVPKPISGTADNGEVVISGNHKGSHNIHKAFLLRKNGADEPYLVGKNNSHNQPMIGIRYQCWQYVPQPNFWM